MERFEGRHERHARDRPAPVRVVAAACGSSSKSYAADNIISAGQADIQLPPGWTVTKDGKGAIRPASDGASAGAAAATGASGATGSATGDTIPLA